MDSRETVIKKMNPHPISHFIFYFVGVTFFIVGFFFHWGIVLAGFIIFSLGEISRRAESFYVLESGVAREYRLLATSRDFAMYKNIQNVKAQQSFLQNIFGIGDVHFDTSGGNHAEIVWRGVKSPYDIEGLVREKTKSAI